MTAFDAIFAGDAIAELQDQFGEAVTYHPYGGDPIATTALITRGPFEAKRGQASPQVDWSVELRIAQATIGHVNIQGDQVELPERKGDPRMRRYRIVKLLDQSGGFWHLGLA